MIVTAWMSIGLAWAPAVYLMDNLNGAHESFFHSLTLSVSSFLPWIAVTRAVLALCRGADQAKHQKRALAWLLAGSVAILPAVAALGRLCSWLAARLTGMNLAFGTPASWLSAITITSLFLLPTALALVAIGLILAASERAAAREHMLANARLDALRAELNPHFLFNSLGGIAQLAHQSPDQAEQAIGNLADIMRSTLAERRRLRPLGEEVAGVRDHLELHAALVEKTALDLDIGPEAWRLAVPPHILTPLVENAITHGVADFEGGFILTLAARREGDRLVITVANPCGALSASSGLGSGIANVRARLEALFGPAADVAVEHSDRFVVTLRLPAINDPADG